jgi:hypothetical protein
MSLFNTIGVALMKAFYKITLSWLAVLGLSCSLQGCTILAIADTAGSIAVKTVGVAADAAIGTAKVTSKVVGATVGAVLPGDDEKK